MPKALGPSKSRLLAKPHFRLAGVVGVLVLAVLAGYIVRTSRAAAPVGDLNNDNTVNIFDLSILFSRWGQAGANTADLNGDNMVNIFDLSILLSHWGQIGTPTPTQTPTPSPTGTPGGSPTPPPGQTSNCMPNPHLCGYPDATNTGPAAAGYTNLTPYTGPRIITTAGTVISGKIITTSLDIEASNVTVQGNLIHSSTYAPGDEPIIRIGATGAKILDNEIRGDSASDNSQDPASGIKAYADSAEIRRNNLYWWAGDGITVDTNNVTITDNFMHDFVNRTGVHFDGIVDDNPANSSLTIRHNTLQMWVDGMTGLVALQLSTTGFLVDNNLLAGGGYTAEGGQQWTNNRFSKMFSPSCGYFGPAAYTPAWGSSGRVWSGNVWDDTGAVIPAP